MSVVRHAVTRSAAAALSGAALLAAPGVAAADPPPGCTTADMTAVMSAASATLSEYLFSHPEVNSFFTGLQGLPKTQVRDQTEGYLDANPTVRADLENIRSASREFRARCNLPQRALILADAI